MPHVRKRPDLFVVGAHDKDGRHALRSALCVRTLAYDDVFHAEFVAAHAEGARAAHKKIQVPRLLRGELGVVGEFNRLEPVLGKAFFEVLDGLCIRADVEIGREGVDKTDAHDGPRVPARRLG